MAGVNKSTVSRVLRGRRDVAVATRRRVLDAAKQLGYRLDPALSRIAAMRWRKQHMHAGNRIAFVESERSADHERYWRGVSRQADPLGYGVDRFCLDDYHSVASVGSILLTRGVKLVVLAGFPSASALVGFPTQSFLAVHCGPTEPGFPFSSVMMDLPRVLSEVWTTVRRAGLVRIGLVQYHYCESHYRSLQLAGTYRALQALASDPVVPTLQIHDKAPGAAMRAQAAGWLRETAPDLIIVGCDLASEPFVELRERGLAIPPLVSLATDPEATGIAGYTRGLGELGALAVRQLHLNYLAGEHVAARSMNSLVEPTWQDDHLLSSSIATWIDQHPPPERLIA